VPTLSDPNLYAIYLPGPPPVVLYDWPYHTFEWGFHQLTLSGDLVYDAYAAHEEDLSGRTLLLFGRAG